MILLASKSPFKISLLKKITNNFETIDPDLDESDIQNNTELSTSEKALSLAIQKAQKIQDYAKTDDIIIATDQIAEINHEILKKPGNKEKNLEHLLKLNGQTHRLYTATCIIHNDKIHKHIDTAKITMKDLTKEDLIEYIKKDEPWMCAGGYKFEQNGHKLMAKVNVKDPISIQGLCFNFVKDYLNQIRA